MGRGQRGRHFPLIGVLLTAVVHLLGTKDWLRAGGWGCGKSLGLGTVLRGVRGLDSNTHQHSSAPMTRAWKPTYRHVIRTKKRIYVKPGMRSPAAELES